MQDRDGRLLHNDESEDGLIRLFKTLLHNVSYVLMILEFGLRDRALLSDGFHGHRWASESLANRKIRTKSCKTAPCRTLVEFASCCENEILRTSCRKL